MNQSKKQILKWIDDDKDELVDFLSRFLQAKSPNPPGDTREAAKVITEFLDKNSLPYRIIAPNEKMVNIVGAYDMTSKGKHLVLNGHIDVYPVGDAKGWKYDPWGGTIDQGRIYGRGSNDMKAGTTASIFTYMYLGNAFYIYVGAVMAGVSWAVIDDREHYKMLKYMYVAPSNTAFTFFLPYTT